MRSYMERPLCMMVKQPRKLHRHSTDTAASVHPSKSVCAVCGKPQSPHMPMNMYNLVSQLLIGFQGATWPLTLMQINMTAWLVDMTKSGSPKVPCQPSF